MKKLILILLLFVPGLAFSQEPEFIGEVGLLQNDTLKVLDKEYLSTKTNVDASLIFFGLGSAHTKMVVPGRNSSLRVRPGQSLNLIARAVDNNSDPMSVVRIFQFEVYRNSRKAIISSADVFGGINRGELKNIKFGATKFGQSSYSIKFSSLPVGEYGVLVYNPNSQGSGARLIYCFGVGTPKWGSGFPQYNADGVY